MFIARLGNFRGEVSRRVLCMLNLAVHNSASMGSADWASGMEAPVCTILERTRHRTIVRCWHGQWVLSTGLFMPQSDDAQCLNDWRSSRHCLSDGVWELGSMVPAGAALGMVKIACMHICRES